MSQTPVQYGSAAALGSTLLVFGVIVVAMQKVLLRDRKRFVTHGGKAFRSPGRPSKLAAVALVGYTFIATVLPGQRARRRVAVEVLERRHRRRRLHARQLPADLRAVQRHRRHLQQRHDLADRRGDQPPARLRRRLDHPQRQGVRPAAGGRRLPGRHPPRGPGRVVRRRLPPDLHRGAVRALRHPLGHRAGLRHPHAAVRDPHAALRPRLARRGLRRGGARRVARA